MQPHKKFPVTLVHILTEDHKSSKILEITATTNNEYSAVTYRPATANEALNENIFEISNSPIRPFKRTKKEEEKEVVIEQLSTTELCLAPDPKPSGPTVNPLSRIYLLLNDTSIPLQNASLSYIYDQAIRWKMKLHHQHSQIYQTRLEMQPDWSNLPNRRPHQCIPAKVKDIRFLAMHNSIKIGRQLIHIPDIEPAKIKCHNCDAEENDILHMFIYCPITNNAWSHLQEKWQELVGSYEDFTDPPDLEIQQYQKLFGIENISRKNNNWNKYVLQHTLDILLGNMQHAINRHYNQFLFDMKKPNENELIHMFEQNMTAALNKMYNRMKRPLYKNQWIYSRPRRNLEQISKENWHTALAEILQKTMKPDEKTEQKQELIELTSDLDEDDNEENF